jgi:RNA polymerase sigma factor (sigma-70 family)
MQVAAAGRTIGRGEGKRQKSNPIFSLSSASAEGACDMACSTVYVIDDDASFRTAIARLLSASDYHVVVYESADQFAASSPPQERGCILLDVQMPGRSGLDLQNLLHSSGSILPIVFLTGHGDIQTTVRAIKAGAEDFLSKPASKEELFAAIDRALVRYDLAERRTAHLNTANACVKTLTPREREVFALLVRGKPHKQIAYELGTAERTIKAHRHSIMEKLKVRSLAEAVIIASSIGITGEPGDAGNP